MSFIRHYMMKNFQGLVKRLQKCQKSILSIVVIFIHHILDNENFQDLVKSNVIKIGPDRPVRPVQLETRLISGLHRHTKPEI